MTQVVQMLKVSQCNVVSQCCDSMFCNVVTQVVQQILKCHNAVTRWYAMLCNVVQCCANAKKKNKTDVTLSRPLTQSDTGKDEQQRPEK